MVILLIYQAFAEDLNAEIQSEYHNESLIILIESQNRQKQLLLPLKTAFQSEDRTFQILFH